MKVACKLVRNGNSTHVCIPRRVLDALRWRSGDQVILEMTDMDSLAIHPPRVADLRIAGAIGVIEGSLPGAAR